jgi:hypothetical protein
VLGEAEYFRQPNQRGGDILIRDMRKDDIRGHGAVFFNMNHMQHDDARGRSGGLVDYNKP